MGLETLMQSVKDHNEQNRFHLNVKEIKIMDIGKCEEEVVIMIDGEEIE